jgi:hypothetical protein
VNDIASETGECGLGPVERDVGMRGVLRHRGSKRMAPKFLFIDSPLQVNECKTDGFARKISEYPRESSFGLSSVK